MFVLMEILKFYGDLLTFIYSFILWFMVIY